MQAMAAFAVPTFLADDDPFGIFIACFFMLVIVVGGFYAVVWLRKRIWNSEDEAVSGVGFTLGDLRQLHKTGQISEEEFGRAKEKIVAAARRAAERDAAAKAGPQNPPAGGQ
jgi:hypothetical protein